MRSGRKTDHSRTFIIQRADNAPKNPKIRDVGGRKSQVSGVNHILSDCHSNDCKCLSEVTTTITRLTDYVIPIAD